MPTHYDDMLKLYCALGETKPPIPPIPSTQKPEQPVQSKPVKPPIPSTHTHISEQPVQSKPVKPAVFEYENNTLDFEYENNTLDLDSENTFERQLALKHRVFLVCQKTHNERILRKIQKLEMFDNFVFLTIGIISGIFILRTLRLRQA